MSDFVERFFFSVFKNRAVQYCFRSRAEVIVFLHP